MAKKSYGNSQTSNQIPEPQQNKEQISIFQKIVKEIPFFAFIIFIVGIVWFVNHSPDGDKRTMTESTTQSDTSKFISSEATETDSTEEVIQAAIDENDPKRVGIITCDTDGMTVHHYSYNKQSDNWINDDDPYDIIDKYTDDDWSDRDDLGDSPVASYDKTYKRGNSEFFQLVTYDDNGDWFSVHDSGYLSGGCQIATCSIDKFEKMKQFGFVAPSEYNPGTYHHYTYDEHEETTQESDAGDHILELIDEYDSTEEERFTEEPIPDDDNQSDDYYDDYTIEYNGQDTKATKYSGWVADDYDPHSFSPQPEFFSDLKRNVYKMSDIIIAKSIYHVMLSKDYNTNGFIYNDCHYSFNSDKWVNDETGESLDDIPDEVLSRTKELYKQYGFDYKGYHHSYDSDSDKWICDDNSAVSYDYDSIPNDIDIVWLKESL